MINISEIINTDCYIDCGSNEKLREVVKEIDNLGIEMFGNMMPADTFIRLTMHKCYSTLIHPIYNFPTHHINDIIF